MLSQELQGRLERETEEVAAPWNLSMCIRSWRLVSVLCTFGSPVVRVKLAVQSRGTKWWRASEGSSRASLERIKTLVVQRWYVRWNSRFAIPTCLSVHSTSRRIMRMLLSKFTSLQIRGPRPVTVAAISMFESQSKCRKKDVSSVGCLTLWIIYIPTVVASATEGQSWCEIHLWCELCLKSF
jgi:hypothetical protein